jgi:hypothetical protein
MIVLIELGLIEIFLKALPIFSKKNGEYIFRALKNK